MEAISPPTKRSIKDLRVAKGLTQMQLAIAVGMDTASISKLENGHRQPSGVTLQRLAKALDVDASFIDIGSIA